ncbi:bacterial transcriptional activator domain-containing protein [Candidatus Saccharibacteria bacterium]|nr:bacterial transcriptional activator domain-containing protein [Candidatus Saccharibacteria bacterium]MCA9333668.1 bacterial transcriptional activator domain-containing protein [Candidatus Saccharibacteria bacterium]
MNTSSLFNKITSLSLSNLSPVSVAVLGTIRLTVNGKPARIKSESKAAYLLLYLTLARPHRLQRTELLDRVWPGVESTLAGQCLNSLTYSLNKLTRPFLKIPELIIHQSGYYHLNTEEGVTVDLDYFEAWSEQGKNLLANGNISDGLAFCQQALALYQGKLGGESNLETLIERERLHLIFLDLLARLADHYYAHHEPVEALCYIQRLLTHDPCREDAHRLAMRCYTRIHQRTQALRQYQLCCQALALEFDIQPEPETIALFERIRLHPNNICSN